MKQKKKKRKNKKGGEILFKGDREHETIYCKFLTV